MKLNSKGTSLIEIVIAIAIIGIIVGPFLLTFNQSMEMTKQTDKLFVASQSAASVMENIKKVAAEGGNVDEAKQAATEYINNKTGLNGLLISIDSLDIENDGLEHNFKKVLLTLTVTDSTGDEVKTKLENWIQFDVTE